MTSRGPCSHTQLRQDNIIEEGLTGPWAASSPLPASNSFPFRSLISHLRSGPPWEASHVGLEGMTPRGIWDCLQGIKTAKHGRCNRLKCAKQAGRGLGPRFPSHRSKSRSPSPLCPSQLASLCFRRATLKAGRAACLGLVPGWEKCKTLWQRISPRRVGLHVSPENGEAPPGFPRRQGYCRQRGKALPA